MLPFTLKYQSTRSEYVAFSNLILKDKYVSHTSLCNGSCNCCVRTNRPDTPISKHSSTNVSICNIVCWISKTYILILKILHLRAVPGVEFIISIPETCSLYTCIEYSDTPHDLLLTWICDVVLTHTNILLSCQPPLNVSNSCLVLLLVLADHLDLTHNQCDHR